MRPTHWPESSQRDGRGTCPQNRHATGRHGLCKCEQDSQRQASAGHRCKEPGGSAGRSGTQAGRGQPCCCRQGPGRRDQGKAASGQDARRRQGRGATAPASLRCGQKAAREAEALAKTAQDAANKLDDEAKKATVQAAARRTVSQCQPGPGPQNERQAMAQASARFAEVARSRGTQQGSQPKPWQTSRNRQPRPPNGAKAKTGDAARAALARGRRLHCKLQLTAMPRPEKLCGP